MTQSYATLYCQGTYHEQFKRLLCDLLDLKHNIEILNRMRDEAIFLIINVRIITIRFKYYENEHGKDGYGKGSEAH